MAGLLPNTSERLVPEAGHTRDDYLMYLRHVFAYEFAGTALAGSRSVLDLGCGEGYGTARLAKNVGQIVGLDVERSVIERAGRKYGAANCRFECYDGLRLPFADQAFDGVVSFQVLEHVPHAAQYVAEAARVLRASGRLILTTPNRANRLRPGARPWNRFHVHEYGAAELRELLGRSFQEVQVEGVAARGEVHEIEMTRIRRAQRIVALDPLNLRRLIPESLMPLAAGIAQRLLPTKKSPGGAGDWTSRYSLQDFFVTADDVDNSLDLLGLCRK